MIADHLKAGKKNAKTGRALASILHCDIRDISAGVERERRQGQPIIASCDPENPGYYLAETAEELRRYCSKLHHRAGEIFKTRSALLDAAQTMPADPEAGTDKNQNDHPEKGSRQGI